MLVYLQISGLGPMLGSGFWLIASERFDPRTAKRRFGQIAGAGTLGGLLGGLLAERVAAVLGVAAMLPVLGLFHFSAPGRSAALAIESDVVPNAAAAVEISQPHRRPDPLRPARARRGALPAQPRASWSCSARPAPRWSTTSSRCAAVEAFGRGDNLLRFFAVYYAATSLITFVIQTSSSRFVLERFGLAATASTPSFALLAGGVGALLAPGFGAIAWRAAASRCSAARCSAPATSCSTRRSRRPKSAPPSRSSTSAFDRLGDAVGGGMIRAVLMLGAGDASTSAILSLAIGCSVAAMLAASRLNRGYISTLERSLLEPRRRARSLRRRGLRPRGR